VWLDCSRKTLLHYETKDEFLPSIQRARERIENFGESALYDKNVPTKGVIFSLTNNGDGWAEKTEQKIEIPKDGAAGMVGGSS